MATYLERIEKLDLSDVIRLIESLDHGQIILDTCENRTELNECLALNFQDETIDEIELIIIESGM